jgi:hypothetical protein
VSQSVSASFGDLLRSMLRPVCPICQIRILSGGIARGFSDDDFHTFRCDHAHSAPAVDDPLTSGTKGWLDGEWRPPA